MQARLRVFPRKLRFRMNFWRISSLNSLKKKESKSNPSTTVLPLGVFWTKPFFYTKRMKISLNTNTVPVLVIIYSLLFCWRLNECVALKSSQCFLKLPQIFMSSTSIYKSSFWRQNNQDIIDKFVAKEFFFPYSVEWSNETDGIHLPEIAFSFLLFANETNNWRKKQLVDYRWRCKIAIYSQRAYPTRTAKWRELRKNKIITTPHELAMPNSTIREILAHIKK